MFTIPYTHYALLYLDNDGKPSIEASPSIAGSENDIFTQDVRGRFLRSVTGGPSALSGYHSSKPPTSKHHTDALNIDTVLYHQQTLSSKVKTAHFCPALPWPCIINLGQDDQISSPVNGSRSGVNARSDETPRQHLLLPVLLFDVRHCAWETTIFCGGTMRRHLTISSS